MKHLSLFLAIAILLFACEEGRNVEVEIKDNDPDTVVISQRDTVWVEYQDRSDTVFIHVPEDEQMPEVPGRNWTAGTVTKLHRVKGVATIRDIRLAGHNGFERLVVEFQGQIPPYEIKYIDEPYIQCGSGNQMWLQGDGLLQVHLRDARAHTDQGQSTVRRNYPALENILEAKVACDYEAHVHILAGVGSPNRYAVFELQNPPRLVIDIRK